jgi:hypothetical protein
LSYHLPITITDMTTAQISIKLELQRRIDLIQNPAFISKCATLAKEVGITAKEWDENYAVILMKFANQVCKIQNEIA